MPERDVFELAADHGQCRFCAASSGQRQFWRETFAGSGQELRRCAHCAGVYLAPDLTAASLQGFYREHYRRLFPAEVIWRSRERFFAWRGDRQVAQQRLALIEAQLPAAAQLFEMGSGFGAFLGAVARRRPDVRLLASEPDLAQREALLDGAAVRFVDGLEALPAASLDALVAFHVLEHLVAPRAFLAEVRRCLKVGGRAWIEVPDLMSGWTRRNYVQPAHLSYFAAAQLERLARAEGLQVLGCGSHPLGGALAENLWLVLACRAEDPSGALPAAPAAEVSAVDRRLERVGWGWRDRLRRLLKRSLVGLLGAGPLGEWQRWRQHCRERATRSI